MTSSVAAYSTVLGADGANRLDAEFFDQDRAKLETQLLDDGGRPLRAVATSAAVYVDPVRDGRGNDFAYVEIGAVDTRDGFVLARSVPRSAAPSRARLLVSVNDVLLSSVRPLRNQVVYAFDDLDQAVATSGFVALQARDQFPPEVLFAFLKTRTAVQQLDRRARASMYPTLNPPEVLDIVLPAVDSDVADDVVAAIRRAGKARVRYLAAAASAQSCSRDFFNQLVPDKVWAGLDSPGSRGRTLRHVFSANGNRMDAEFHSPAFDEAVEKMTSAGEVESLGQISTRVNTGRSPAAADFSEEDTGGPVMLKLAMLSGIGVNWAAATFAPSNWKVTEAAQLEEGDVLFNSTAHEPNYVAHRVDAVGKPPPGYVNRLTFVADLVRLRLADKNRTPPHYVAAFVRSRLGREQIKRCIRGVRAHVYPQDIADEVRIPIPPRGVAEAITKYAHVAERERWSYSSHVHDAVATLDKHIAERLAEGDRTATPVSRRHGG